MPATIQTIEKPLRARAWDTSTSTQVVSQNMVTNGDFASNITGWDEVSVGAGETAPRFDANDGVSSGGCCEILVTDGGYIGIKQDITFTAGRRYRVSISAKAASGDNGKQFRFMDNATATISPLVDSGDHIHTLTESHATYTTEWIANENSNRISIVRQSTGTWEFFVDNIEIVEIASLGNNNHGQIYSGRALEFDGVTDYISVNGGNVLTLVDYSAGSTNADRAWTVAVSFRFDAAGSTHQHILGYGTSNSIGYLSVTSNEKFGLWNMKSNPDDAFIEASTVLNINTWYRGVAVFDGDETVRLYVNGVQDGTGTINTAGAYADLAFKWIGDWDPAHATRRQFPGALSDLQCWKGAWTASDVLFDYQNPEQLALNNSGTSLTESNLKLWYPMNDGHRGNQSYILDASNTGLGDNLVTDPGCNATLVAGDSQELGWSIGASGDSVMANGVLTLKGSGGNSYIGQSAILTVGVTYKIVFDATVRAGEGKIEKTGGGLMYSITSSGSHTVYWTADSTDLKFNRVDTACDMDIDNVYCYPVNDKNHGTTVFYGDELISDVNNRTFASSSNWDGSNVNTSDDTNDFVEFSAAASSGADESTALTAYDGTTVTFADNYLKVRSDSDGSNNQYCFLDGGGSSGSEKWEGSMVAGRRYRLSYAIQVTARTSGSIRVGMSNDDAVQALSDLTVYNEYDAVHTNATTGYVDFTYSTADHERISIMTPINSVVTAYFDNFSIKEIGTATGWTDADQQLTIPQTALQSYNQLMWFDGTADCVQTSPSGSIWNASGSYGDWNSVSCWVYQNEGQTSGDYWSIENVMPALYFQSNSTNYWIGYNTGNGDVFGIETAKTNIDGKWHHWVMNWKRNNNSADTAISASDVELFWNGEKQTLAYHTPTTDSNPVSHASDADINFMCNSAANAQFVNGSITEISTWTDQLTLAEVEELYNDGKALDALTHSNVSNLTAYWRNNGLATWTQLKGSNGGSPSPTSGAETMLITAGVDASRDSQGFIMNRQRNTSSLNLPANDGAEDVRIDTASGASPGDNINFVSNAFSFSCWVKLRYATGSAQIVFDRGDGTDGFLLKASATGIPVFVTEKDNTETSSTASGSNGGLSSGVMSFDTWYFICGTHEGLASSADQYLYVGCPSATDSSLYCVALQANGIIMDTSAADLRIGRRYSNTLPFNGAIDDLIFYDKELTAFESDGSVAESGDKITSGEVLRNYNAGKRSHK